MSTDFQIRLVLPGGRTKYPDGQYPIINTFFGGETQRLHQKVDNFLISSSPSIWVKAFSV